MCAHLKIALVMFLLLLSSSVWANDLKQEKSTIHFKSYLLSYSDEIANQELDSNKSIDQRQEEAYQEYKKELLKSYLIAAVPGFIVHGAGNMSAGRTGTGLTLFSLELLSIIGILSWEMQGWMGNSNGENGKNLAIGFGSIMLFFGTWIYDIATVEFAVKAKYEKRKINISLLQFSNHNFTNPNTFSLINLSINL